MRQLNLWITIVPSGNLSRHFLQWSERFVDTRRWSKITNHNLFAEIETFLNFSKHFSLKYCSNECQKLPKDLKKTELKLSWLLAQNLKHSNFQKRWLDIIREDVLEKEYGKPHTQTGNHKSISYLFILTVKNLKLCILIPIWSKWILIKVTLLQLLLLLGFP